MAKPRKIQLHSANLQMWNSRGTSDFSAFSPADVLAGDSWLSSASAVVSGLQIRNGDLIIALTDNPAAISQASVDAGDWKLIRNLTDDELTWLEAQLYNPPSASLSGGTTLEKNYAVSPYSASLAWSVTEGSNPITTKQLWKKEGAGSWVKVDDLTGTSGTESVDVNINVDTQFRVLVSSKSGEEIYSTIRTVAFQYKVGYRVGVASPTVNDAWLKAGTLVFDTDEFRSFSVNAATDEHIYYYVPKAYVSDPYISPPYFYVGGFEGGFAVLTSSAAYEFGDESIEDYVVYRSTQSGLGNTTVTVQNS